MNGNVVAKDTGQLVLGMINLQQTSVDSWLHYGFLESNTCFSLEYET